MKFSITIWKWGKLSRIVVVAIIGCFAGTEISLAQDRCGTVPYMKKLRDQKNILENDVQFENWIKNKIENRKVTLGTKATTYKIPVVVHVIHKGEPLGTGSNISDQQIFSQIAVLNKDFNRLNSDASSTPAEFQPVAGAMNVEFTLAKRSPEGLATTGIVRMKGSQSSWTMNDNSTLKATSYWPAEDYMNIWVTDLAGSLIGYAQFPVSNLPGLENSPNNRLTDGVVIDYFNFGTTDAGSFSLDGNYNKGRTATHEIGHFFGLKHIWGDDENASNPCSGSDHVNDTPDQESSTNGCPSHPRASCSATNMFQNYLDYTYDRCMNMFTTGQVNRMISVVENSPRRLSLWTTSQGLTDPVPVANDLGIKKIVLPSLSECTGNFSPSIEVKNYGTNLITSARIALTRNNVVQQTTDFTINLDPSKMTTLTFNSQSVPPGTYDFEFEIILTNGVTDGRAADNNESITTLIPESIAAPFIENFNTSPTSWIVTNPDDLYTWGIKPAPNSNSANTAMFMNFYNYEDSQGQTDILTTPVFNLSNAQTAYFIFDVSYAQFTGREDALKVYVMTDCHTDISQGIEVYDKSGFALATASSTSTAYVPKGGKDWRKEVVDISSFIGEGNVQLAFVGVNDWGNNLYIDNISLVTSAKEDIALTEIISPTPVSCEEKIAPKLKIKNLSKVINSDSVASVIRTFKVLYDLNGGGFQSAGVFNPNFLPGKEVEITLPSITFQEGSDSITFKLTEPNELVDINSSDNERTIHLVVNKSSDRIPLRENFDSESIDQWTMVNPGEGKAWKTVPTNYNQSVYFDAFEDPIQSREAWLVSPILDFTLAKNASVFFDLSYAHLPPFTDSLRLLASRDCGSSYKLIKPTLKGAMLSEKSSLTPWKPLAEEDWVRKYYNLDTLAGESNVRLAFVFNSNRGNRVYIDNIEFFVSDNPSPPTIADPYLIYGTQPFDDGDFYLTFNLDERRTVGYEVVNMFGQTIVQEEIVDVLNQTFLIDAGIVQSGLYIVRLQIDDTYYATKVFINR